jgi:sigma-B regulation protein RsbU (phosphoserine phosphatase)
MPTLRLPAVMESLESFQSFVFRQMEQEGLDELTPQVDLTLEEVLVNVIHYAYPQGDGEIEMECRMEAPGSLYLAFRDWGIPFNPLDQPPPDLTADISERRVGGLGIYLAKEMAARLSYEYREGCNVLMLWFEKKG